MRSILLALSVMLLMACDPVWLKDRTMSFPIANVSCIEQGLASVPEIKSVLVRTDPALFYLKSKESSETIASIGTNASGSTEVVLLVSPGVDLEQRNLILNKVAVGVEKTCGGT
jgi:hypothetical protein